MSFGDLEQQGEDAFCEINMTPLVDVMLVLLIIFMVTMPVLTQAVKVDLPKTPPQPAPMTQTPVGLSIDGKGQWFWDKAPVSDTEAEARLKALAPDTRLNVYADKGVRYERVAMLLALIQAQGLSKVALAVTPT